MKRFNTVLLALGFGCLLYLIEMTGWRQLWHQFTALGWGITLIILVEGAANVAHTVGWQHCIFRSQKQTSLWRLFRINMAGWAINYLTPTASIGGEVTRASLLAGHRDGTAAVGSVFLDKLTTAVAHLLLVSIGAVLLFCRVKLPPQFWITMAITTALITAGIAAFFLFQTSGLLETGCRWLVRHKLGRRIAERMVANLSKVDGLLRQFYRDHPRELMLSILWHALGHSVALAHTWLFLTLIGSPEPLVMVAAAASLALWFDLLTFAIPANLGTLEASRALALKLLGCEALLGVTFGVAIRAAQVFWAGFGLVSYALITARRTGIRKSAPHLNEITENVCTEERI